MAFHLQHFYDELDAHYAAHNLEETERFLLRSKAEACNAGVQLPLDTGCPSCAPELEPNLEYVSVCNETACFYRGLSRWQDSLDTFSEAQRELEYCLRSDTAEYATVLLNKAGTYRYMGDLENALSHFKRAAEIFKKSGAASGTLAGLYNNVGLVYLDKKEPGQALSFFRQALPLICDDPEHIVETGTTWNNIATALDMLGETGEAVEACTCSCTILEALDCGVNPHYPNSLNTRGVLSYKAGKYDAALEDMCKASEIIRLVYGENIEYAYSLANLAAVYGQLGQNTRADELLNASNALREKLRQG